MIEMYPEAYNDWIGMFKDDLLETWQKERKELQKAAMLLIALQKELKDVQTNLEKELINLRHQLKYKDSLEEKRKSLSPKHRKKKSPKSVNNENECIDSDTTLAHFLEDTIPFTQRESPDLFKNIVPNINQPVTNISIIDLSFSDTETTTDGSPTIKRRRRHHHRSKVPSPPQVNNRTDIESKRVENTPLNKMVAENSVKTNLFKTPVLKPDDDFSIIENTPDVNHQRSGTISSRVGGISLRKTGKSKRTANHTLTQMFGNVRKKLEMNINKETKEEDTDSDETYFEVATEGSKMGITDMLNYINKDETINQEKSPSVSQSQGNNDDIIACDLDSSQEVDQFSKGAIFNESDVSTSSEKCKVIPLEAEPVVRGKAARKQLQGWACDKCRNFYEKMNLPPGELKKRMDECSRHRYKYRPPEETPPGFWDLSIPPENPN